MVVLFIASALIVAAYVASVTWLLIAYCKADRWPPDA